MARTHRLRGYIHPLTGLLWSLLLLPAALSADEARSIAYRVVGHYPHDPEAFTQGLLFHRGFLYESTGRYGHSTLRQVDIETGTTVRKVPLSRRYFGEGLTLRGNDTLVQLSWRAGTGFIYRLDSFDRIGEFNYEGEGWGLATGADHLIMSDGSHQLRFLDPLTFEEVRRLDVTDNGTPLPRINELEMVDGALFANVLGLDRIARIDPESGEVTGWLDLAPLRGTGGKWRRAADLNGIAWDKHTGRLLVTGKHWPGLYAIVVEPE